MLSLALGAVGGFLLVGFFAPLLARHAVGRPLVYGASAVLSAIVLAAATFELITAAGPSAELVLPLGLPWIGVHFWVDALAAAFLVVINIGAAAASLFGLGDGRHE